MGEITKDNLLFERDEKGELIEREVVLETLKNKPTVKIKPLTRGKLQRIRMKATSNNLDEKIESDNDILREGLISPKLTDEELKNIKPQKANAIIMAIISISLDIPQSEVNKDVDKMVKDQEENLKKKA